MIEPVDVPAGRLEAALLLQREPQRPYDTRVDVWLDPARHHLPARARLTAVVTACTASACAKLPDQAAMFGGFGASAHNSGSAREAVHHVIRALALLDVPPSRPVYVGVPSDVLEEAWVGPSPEWAMPAPPRVEEAAVERIADALAMSVRPMIWAGGGVVSSGAE